MTASPIVSIIIPVYNAEKFISMTIESCVSQTYENIDIIIINDGSTDLSENLIKQFKDKRIRYFKKTNEGPCIARNFGTLKAKGSLFQFLDHDDLLDKNKILHQVAMYHTYGPDYVYAGNMGTVVDRTCTEDEGYELYKRNLTPQEYYATVLNQFGKFITTGAWLIPKKIIDLTYGWDEKAGLNDDGEYFMRLILRSKGIIYCKGSNFYFRRGVVNSLSKQFNSKAVYEKWFYSYQSYVRNFQHAFDKKIANELSWKALSIFYCDSHPNYPELRQICKDHILSLGYTKANPYGGLLFTKIAGLIGTDAALHLFHIKGVFVKKMSVRQLFR